MPFFSPRPSVSVSIPHPIKRLRLVRIFHALNALHSTAIVADTNTVVPHQLNTKHQTMSSQNMYTTSGPSYNYNNGQVPFTQQEQDSMEFANAAIMPSQYLGNDFADFDNDAAGMPNVVLTNADQVFDSRPPMPQEVPPMVPQALMPPVQNLVPMTAYGASYNPMIGWYFPAIPATANFQPAAPEAFMGDMMLTNNNGMDMLSSRANTPRGMKRKPVDSELSDKAKRQRTAAPAPIPRDIFGKPASFAKACVCAAFEQKIPRPKNAFILFRSHYAKQLSRSADIDPSLSKNGRQNNQKVSGLAAKKWREEAPSVRKHFHDLADAEKARHQAMYPDYKYMPGSVKAARYGTPECTCGAYVANEAAREGKKVSRRDVHSEDELEEYVPEQFSQQQAPVAPMVSMAPPAPMPDFGFVIPQQTVDATAAWAAHQAQLLQAPPFALDPALEAPRRSMRNTRKSVSYAEPEESDLETTPTASPAVYDANSTNKRRPAPINTSSSRPQQTQDSPLSAPPTTAQLDQSTPARNTRSKSKSISKSAELPKQNPEGMDLDLDAFLFDESFAQNVGEDLFNYDFDGANEDVGTATRRMSARLSKAVQAQSPKTTAAAAAGYRRMSTRSVARRNR